jgi:hypothetical protein
MPRVTLVSTAAFSGTPAGHERREPGRSQFWGETLAVALLWPRGIRQDRFWSDNLYRAVDVGTIFNQDTRASSVSQQIALGANLNSAARLDISYHIANEDYILGSYVSLDVPLRSDNQRVARKRYLAGYLAIDQHVLLAGDLTFDANSTTDVVRGAHAWVDGRTSPIRGAFISQRIHFL